MASGNYASRAGFNNTGKPNDGRERVPWLVPGSGKARAPATSIQRGGEMQRGVARLPDEARWIWVSLPHATFAIGTHDGQVVSAAPIARWAIGKDEREVANYFRRRGATFRPAGHQQSTQRGGPMQYQPTAYDLGITDEQVEVEVEAEAARDLAEILAEVDGLEAGL